MRIKDRSVKVNGICKEIFEAIVIIDWVCAKYGVEGVITCGSEMTAVHGPNSKHYTGEAVDLRSRDLLALGGQSKIDEFMAEVTSNIGPGYDMVYEGDHYHLEWHPK